MTRGTFIFIGAGLGIYLVASQTQVGWLYLFDAIIWSLLALSVVLPGYTIKSLKVEQQVLLPPSDDSGLPLEGPLEDQTIEVRLKVSNAGRFTRYFVNLIADCPFERPEAQRKSFLLASIRPGSPVIFSYAANCYHRGHYTSANIVFQSGGPLGLIVRKRSISLPLNLTIYPSYHHIEKLPVAGEEWGEGAKSVSASQFYGSRSYQPGDPLKHVHWRNTARVGHFMIKEFEQAGQASLTIVIDTSRDFGSGRETNLEYSIKIAASLAALSARIGHSINIVNAGETSLQYSDWQTAMDFLARLEAHNEAMAAEVEAVEGLRGALVIIVPAVVTPLTTALAQLAQHQRAVLVILEGFASEERPGEVISIFSGSNPEIVRCMRGNLESMVNKLTDSAFFGGESSWRTG